MAVRLQVLALLLLLLSKSIENVPFACLKSCVFRSSGQLSHLILISTVICSFAKAHFHRIETRNIMFAVKNGGLRVYKTICSVHGPRLIETISSFIDHFVFKKFEKALKQLF